MDVGSLYPSIHLKIHGQHRLFIMNFEQTQAPNSNPATCGALAFFNGDFQSHLATAQQGSSSPTITPKPSSSEKDRSNVPAYKWIFLLGYKMIIAPFNRVTNLMQCQNEMIKSGRLSLPYKGVGDCFARTVKNEGIISLWKGNTPHMMGLITTKVLRGDMVEGSPVVLNNIKDKDSLRKLFVKGLASDCFFRAVTLFFVHPLTYAHTRLTNDIITKSNTDKRQFNGLTDVLRKTLKSDGIAGVYRGYNLSFVGGLVHDLLFFVLKDYLSHKMRHSQVSGDMKPSEVPTTFIHNEQTLPLHLLGLPVFVSLITFPADTVVHRMMMRSREDIKYKSSFDAFSQIIKNEGVKSLYKGVSAQIIAYSCIPGLAAILAMISVILKNYGHYVEIERKTDEDDGQGSH